MLSVVRDMEDLSKLFCFVAIVMSIFMFVSRFCDLKWAIKYR